MLEKKALFVRNLSEYVIIKLIQMSPDIFGTGTIRTSPSVSAVFYVNVILLYLSTIHRDLKSLIGLFNALDCYFDAHDIFIEVH